MIKNPNTMKKIYFFLVALVPVTSLFAQDFCADADSNLIYAYSNVKAAYESNNLDHLKYYSEKSLKSFEKAKVNLEKCGCEKAYELAYDGSELLAHVESQETFEDGRFYVKRAKEIAQQSITALNEFSAEKDTDTTSIDEDENDELAALQIEKENLEAQRLALKQKEEAIAKKLAEQKEKTSILEKEALITKYEGALSLNLETYNELLKQYGSTSELSIENKSKDELLSKDKAEIKAYFINNIKQVTTAYLAELNDM